MKIETGTNLWQFKQFADAEFNARRESSVVRVDTTSGPGSLGSLRITAANDDRAYALIRSAAAKSANVRTRDMFYKCVAELFGGSDKIPQSVRDVLTNFDGVNDKPLTARRIRAVVSAIKNVDENTIGQQNVQQKKSDSQELGPLLPEPLFPEQEDKPILAPSAKKCDSLHVFEKAIVAVEKDSAPGSASSILNSFKSLKVFSFFTSEEKPVKVFKKSDSGSITYDDKPKEPDPDECLEIRNRFVASVEQKLVAKKIPDFERNAFINKLKGDILNAKVAKTPLEVNDPHVKEAIKFTDRDISKMYKVDVSTSTGNRGTIKLDTAKFLSSVLLKGVLGDKNIFSWSGVSVTQGDNGFLNLNINDLAIANGQSGGPESLKTIKEMMRAVTIKSATIPLKPVYDPASGKISVTIGKISMPHNPAIAGTLNLGLTKNTILGNLGTAKWDAVRNAGLTEAEEKEGLFGRIEINLSQMGNKKLLGLHLNESFSANVSDMKFTEKGVVVRFGDNVPANNSTSAPLAGTRIRDDEPIGGGDASLTVVPGAYKAIVEEALEGKFGFTSINMTTRSGANGTGGTLDVSLDGVDLSRFADNGGTAVKIARKLGFLKPGNVRVSLRPTIDPISKRIRLDVVSLTYGRGLKNFLAKQFLSKVLKGIFAQKVKGVGVIPGSGDSIVSISADPSQALERLAGKIPGGIPDISHLSADDNGLSIGIDIK